MIAADAHAPAFAVGAAITNSKPIGPMAATPLSAASLLRRRRYYWKTCSNQSFTPPRSQTSFSLPATDWLTRAISRFGRFNSLLENQTLSAILDWWFLASQPNWMPGG
ncbi:MAG: hypothetical protein E5Y25_03125 [Mesorhizobium sp.]|nr:MAG: hypothetical protein E5Y25_03125 [Mesorhizobium sp.]